MALLKIVTTKAPNGAVLHQPTAKVRDFGPSLHKLLDNMLETLREAPGVGLAAPQVGISQQDGVMSILMMRRNRKRRCGSMS